MTLATIPEAIQDIREGKFLIIVDNEDREKRGRSGYRSREGLP
jgi:3,4-dihydroxy-2-butanone 4-phosphate synthase